MTTLSDNAYRQAILNPRTGQTEVIDPDLERLRSMVRLQEFKWLARILERLERAEAKAGRP